MNKDAFHRHHISTLFLRAAIVLIGLVVLAGCIFVLPVGVMDDKVGGYVPIAFGIYLTAIPFYIALYQTLKLLHYIDINRAFSILSVKALKIIRYCALIVGAMYALGLPYIYYVAEQDDAPGVIVMGMMFAFAPLVIAVFAAVLQKLLQSAIDMKSENDLTV